VALLFQGENEAKDSEKGDQVVLRRSFKATELQKDSSWQMKPVSRLQKISVSLSTRGGGGKGGRNKCFSQRNWAYLEGGRVYLGRGKMSLG